VLTFCVFYPVLNSHFVTDDLRLIYISSPLSTDSIFDYFTSSGGWFAGLYRPFVRIAFFMDFSLYHLNPAGYHVTNLLFHIVCSILVFYFAEMLTGSEMTGSFAAFIFAVQPLHTEAVSWISGRGDIIFTFFYLLACVSFLKYLSAKDRKRKYLLLSGFFFFLSLLSKESAITLPAIIFLTEYYYFKRESGNRPHRLNIMNYVPFVLVLILYTFIKLFIVGGGVLHTQTGLSIFLRVGYHFLQLFAPINIDTFNFSNMSGFILNSIIVLNLLILLLAYLYLCRDKKRAIPFFILCALWILITSFPLYLASGTRYLYISSVASSMLIGFVLAHTLSAVKIKIPRLTKTLVPLLMIGIVLTSSIRILQKNEIYNYTGAIAEGIFTQLKNKHPRFPSGSVLYFINFPDEWVRDTETWVKPIPVMSVAIKVKYGDTSLIIRSEPQRVSTFEEKFRFLEKNSIGKYIKEGKQCYIFEYQDSKVIETTKLFRDKLGYTF